MRWAVPVFLACLACLPGAADAGGQAERRPAASTLLLVLDFAPSWSADGTRIAFTRYRHGFGTISADGSGERDLRLAYSERLVLAVSGAFTLAGLLALLLPPRPSSGTARS